MVGGFAFLRAGRGGVDFLSFWAVSGKTYTPCRVKMGLPLWLPVQCLLLPPVVRGTTRQLQIPSCLLTPNDLRRLYGILEQKPPSGSLPP